MVFAEDNAMVGTFATNTSVKPLDIWILPRTVIGRHHLFYAHILDALSKKIAIDAISIPKQVSWRSVPRERLDNLLRGPFGSGILRYVEVHDATPRVTHNNEHEQKVKSNGGHDEEVHANHVRHVVLNHSHPIGICERADSWSEFSE